jgi:hypothetical protein
VDGQASAGAPVEQFIRMLRALLHRELGEFAYGLLLHSVLAIPST